MTAKEAISACVLACLGLACSDGASTRDVGDGVMTDRGFLAFYPRYRVTLPAVLVGEPSNRASYRLSGLPRGTYSLLLVPLIDGVGISSADEWSQLWEDLLAAGVVAQVVVNGVRTGQSRRYFGAALALGAPVGGWTPAGSGTGVRAFSSDGLSSLELDDLAEVGVDLVVETPEIRLSGVALRPVLVAGGFRT